MTALTAQSPHGTNVQAEDSTRLVELLQRPEFYPERTRSVELIETHISWIFLTDEFAYKLKKPVRFDFLDFSTVELRRVACLNEVNLNRRLACGVYVGVVPIGMSARGHLGLGQHGTPIDWIVKMRRLPARNAMDVLIRDGKVSSADIERLAKALSDFYDSAPPVTMTVDHYRESIERHAIANRDELLADRHHLDAAEIRRIHSAQLRILRLAPEMLDERVRNGRIMEGHGDLRPEHVYFNPSPLIIDCIEFNRELRTLDVVDELAFLEMECDFLGADGLTEPIFARYLGRSGDSPPRQLLDFYRVYRACVRAKVSALRAEQLAGEARSRMLAAASKYLDLAVRYAQTLAPPLLVLVRGLPGVGKSTLAREISERLGFELLQTDAIRRTIFASGGDRPDFNEGRYRPRNRLRVYESLHEQAARLLSRGTSIVLDGTYATASLRREAAELAGRHQAEFLAVHCQCSDEIAEQRIRARLRGANSLSETRPEFFDRQRQAEEPDRPGERSLVVDTSSCTAEPMQTVFAALREKWIDGTDRR